MLESIPCNGLFFGFEKNTLWKATGCLLGSLNGEMDVQGWQRQHANEDKGSITRADYALPCTWWGSCPGSTGHRSLMGGGVWRHWSSVTPWCSVTPHRPHPLSWDPIVHGISGHIHHCGESALSCGKCCAGPCSQAATRGATEGAALAQPLAGCSPQRQVSNPSPWSSISISLLWWMGQNWTLWSRCGLRSAEERKSITFLNLSATSLLMQPCISY